MYIKTTDRWILPCCQCDATSWLPTSLPVYVHVCTYCLAWLGLHLYRHIRIRQQPTCVPMPTLYSQVDSSCCSSSTHLLMQFQLSY